MPFFFFFVKSFSGRIVCRVGQKTHKYFRVGTIRFRRSTIARARAVLIGGTFLRLRTIARATSFLFLCSVATLPVLLTLLEYSLFFIIAMFILFGRGLHELCPMNFFRKLIRGELNEK